MNMCKSKCMSYINSNSKCNSNTYSVIEYQFEYVIFIVFVILSKFHICGGCQFCHEHGVLPPVIGL